jgi:pimeloyl-ACP methyl ester carboxylesterase
MSGAMIAATVLASVVGLVLLSYLVETLRAHPKTPSRLPWAPEVPPEYTSIAAGIRVRYIRVGAGPALVLLHTLRTQLDIFETVIPQLATHFTVYALDYPGHGWSDIPGAEYAPEDFYRWVTSFLDSMRLERVTLAGISIGGTIALVLAARRHPRIASVIAINPYDYPPDGGIRHSSLAARVILGPAGVPVLGATLMRLRNRFISDRIMEGGVASVTALSADLKRELYEVGARPGHYQAFLRLLSHEDEWAKARAEYSSIVVPALLIYGEQDWAPEKARAQDRALIPGVTTMAVPGGGHFLSLDKPRELAELITNFGTNHQRQIA